MERSSAFGFLYGEGGMCWSGEDVILEAQTEEVVALGK